MRWRQLDQVDRLLDEFLLIDAAEAEFFGLFFDEVGPVFEDWSLSEERVHAEADGFLLEAGDEVASVVSAS